MEEIVTSQAEKLPGTSSQSAPLNCTLAKAEFIPKGEWASLKHIHFEEQRTPTTPWAEAIVSGGEGGVRVKAIIDTGAEVTLISAAVVDKLKLPTTPFNGRFMVANS